MNKNILPLIFLILTLSLTAISCSKNDEPTNTPLTEQEALSLTFTTSNASAWTNYATNVAQLLAQDSKTLYTAWTTQFASAFKSHSQGSGYTSANACIQQILEGCIDIANEVGTAKIGEPVDYWTAGLQQKALFAVESWYSWHSRDDYKNNILSIANSLLGQPISGNPSDFDYHASVANGSLTTNSILVFCMKSNSLRTSSITVWHDVCNAWNAIDAIPQPFRNNIGSAEATEAMDACDALVKSLESLNALISKDTDTDWQPVVEQFVDGVALPTYKLLAEKNEALLNSVRALQQNPSDQTFSNACIAWLDARQPWETSEAFLFGPVSELGLDPNMDSWPLDAVGIANLLNSQNWNEMNWTGSYDEENEAIEAAQSVRGYHTLEFLLFKDGMPRSVK